jgi:hypothetical protein
MGPAIPFTYAAKSLATAHGLRTEAPPAHRVSAARPRREATRSKRIRVALWHRGARHVPLAKA